jgi:hypothetical protein
MLIDEVMRHCIGPLDPPHVVTGHAVIDYLWTLLPRDADEDDIPLMFSAPQRCPWPQTWVEWPMHADKRLRGVLILEVEGGALRAMARGGPLPPHFPPIAREWTTRMLDTMKARGHGQMEAWDRAPMFHVAFSFSEEQPDRPSGHHISARDLEGVVLSDGTSKHGDKNIFTLALTKGERIAEYVMSVAEIAHMIVALFHVRGMEVETKARDAGTVRARLRRKRPVAVEYTTVSFPGVAFRSAQESRDHQGVIPAHLVRGHFADYTDKGLFGKRKILVWKPMQVRGNPERGVRLSEHRALEPGKELVAR